MSRKEISDLSDQLNFELAWRKKELSSLRFSLDQATDAQQIASISRASIVMLYAHWEGFIKVAIRSFLKHVRLNTSSPSDLSLRFFALWLRHIIPKENSQYALQKFESTIKWLNREEGSMRKMPRLEKEISFNRNIRYQDLKLASFILGINLSKHDTRKNFIDQKLLGGRNKILPCIFFKETCWDFSIVKHFSIYISEKRNTK